MLHQIKGTAERLKQRKGLEDLLQELVDQHNKVRDALIDLDARFSDLEERKCECGANRHRGRAKTGSPTN